MKKIYKYNELTRKQQEEVVKRFLENEKKKYVYFNDLSEDVKEKIAQEEVEYNFNMASWDFWDFIINEAGFDSKLLQTPINWKWFEIDEYDGEVSYSAEIIFNRGFYEIIKNEKVIKIKEQLEDSEYEKNITITIEGKGEAASIESVDFTSYHFSIEEYKLCDELEDILLSDYNLENALTEMAKAIQIYANLYFNVECVKEGKESMGDIYDIEGNHVSWKTMEQFLKEEEEEFIENTKRDDIYFTEDLKRVVIL